MRAATTILLGLGLASALSGCSVTVVNNAPATTPSPTASVDEAKVLRSDTAADKTALVAYAADKGELPKVVGQQLAQALAPYGWVQSKTTKSIQYGTSDALEEKTFCLIVKGTSGGGYVTTTNTPIVAGDKCPLPATSW